MVARATLPTKTPRMQARHGVASGVGIAVLMAACGSTPSASPTTTAEPTSTAPAATTAPAASTVAAPSGAPYELHEWGVVDVPENGAVEISTGAGQPQRPISVRKPVVYVHLLDGVTQTSFGLRVTLGAGTYMEHAPPGAITGTTLEWPSIVASSTHCAPTTASARRGRIACATADGVCEVEELASYDAASAACLTVGSAAPMSLLFYRGQAPSVPLPLTTSRAADLTLTVTATGSMTGAPGGLVRLSTALSGPWPQGRIVVSRAAAPAIGQSLTMPVGTEVITREQGIAELRRSIVALGLTDDEASAFMAGWADELFGADPSRTRDMRESMPMRHQDVLLYFLPEPAIDGISTLTPTPTPRAIHRAFLIRVDLGGVATG